MGRHYTAFLCLGGRFLLWSNRPSDADSSGAGVEFIAEDSEGLASAAVGSYQPDELGVALDSELSLLLGGLSG